MRLLSVHVLHTAPPLSRRENREARHACTVYFVVCRPELVRSLSSVTLAKVSWTFFERQ